MEGEVVLEWTDCTLGRCEASEPVSVSRVCCVCGTGRDPGSASPKIRLGQTHEHTAPTSTPSTHCTLLTPLLQFTHNIKTDLHSASTKKKRFQNIWLYSIIHEALFSPTRWPCSFWNGVDSAESGSAWCPATHLSSGLSLDYEHLNFPGREMLTISHNCHELLEKHRPESSVQLSENMPKCLKEIKSMTCKSRLRSIFRQQSDVGVSADWWHW